MYCNVGSLDRKIRIIFGLLTLASGLYFQSFWFLLGWVPLATGLVEFCPFYALLGVSSSREFKKFWQ